jgi:hypothetical protein
MFLIARFWLPALLLASALPAVAQGNVTELQVKALPGEEVRVGVYVDIKPDCTGGPLPTIKLVVPPAHGVVNVKRGTLKASNYKQCLATEVPGLAAFYRAAAGFSGADEFVLEIALTDRKQLQHFHMNVSGADGAGDQHPI